MVYDSNILIDFLHGRPAAQALLAGRRSRVISIVTWMEVLAGVIGTEEDLIARRMLRHFSVVPVDGRIAEESVSIRRQTRLKLPDAVILATARTQGLTLVTRNTKDFDASDPGIMVPYVLEG